MLDRQIYGTPDPCFDTIYNSLSVHRDGFFYEVTTTSADLARHMPVLYVEPGAHLCVALTFKIGNRESFNEMTDLWQSTIGSVAEMQQRPLPITVLVIGFWLGSDCLENTKAILHYGIPEGMVIREREEERGEVFARTYGYLYGECDCRTGSGTREAFTRAVEEAHAVARVRFAGDPEGLKSYRQRAKMACYGLVKACCPETVGIGECKGLE